MKFHIVRVDKNGREFYRFLIDDEHHLTWAAGSDHSDSISEINRNKVWTKKYPNTQNFKLKVMLAAQKRQLKNNKSLLTKLLNAEHHTVIGEQLSWSIEPQDPEKLERVVEKQRKYIKSQVKQQQPEQNTLAKHKRFRLGVAR